MTDRSKRNHQGRINALLSQAFYPLWTCVVQDMQLGSSSDKGISLSMQFPKDALLYQFSQATSRSRGYWIKRNPPYHTLDAGYIWRPLDGISFTKVDRNPPAATKKELREVLCSCVHATLKERGWPRDKASLYSSGALSLLKLAIFYYTLFFSTGRPFLLSETM